VARRLELLSAELTSVREPSPDPAEPVLDGPTRIRRAVGPEPEDLPAVPALPVPGRHAARGTTYAGWQALRGRVSLGPAQVAVIAVLVALGMALTTWWVLRDRASPVASTPLAGPALATPVPPPDGQAGSAPVAAAPSKELVVDVAGKVRRPGIVVLEPGDRVIDALEAAGGVRKGVDTTDLNLARVLIDGEQLLVGISPPPGAAASAAASPGGPPGAALVNINVATQGELEELPGVGPVTAQAILAWRTEHGGFASVDQLVDVSGIGEATLADLAPLVTIG